MEGLSARKRKTYLGALTLAFFVLVPLVALYATGYRLTSDFDIIKTGGIHVNVPTSGAQFYLNDRFAGSGTIFQKSYFVQNLTPDIYTVRIEKDEYYPWRKQIEVFPTVISEASALLIPEEPTLTNVPARTVSAGFALNGADSEDRVPNRRYEEITASFSATSTGVLAAPLGATTTIQFEGATTTVHEKNGIGLWLDKAGLHAVWLEDTEDSPYVFCELNVCERTILVWDRASDIEHFDFLPANALFVVLERSDGVVVTELDMRIPQNVVPLYLEDKAQFRIIDDVMYVLDGEELFEVEM